MRSDLTKVRAMEDQSIVEIFFRGRYQWGPDRRCIRSYTARM